MAYGSYKRSAWFIQLVDSTAGNFNLISIQFKLLSDIAHFSESNRNNSITLMFWCPQNSVNTAVNAFACRWATPPSTATPSTPPNTPNSTVKRYSRRRLFSFFCSTSMRLHSMPRTALDTRNGSQELAACNLFNGFPCHAHTPTAEPNPKYVE